MSVLGLAACGILNYPKYVRQLLTVVTVNLPQQRAERIAAASTTSNHVVNLLAPRGRRDGASIGHDGDILTVCDSGQTRTRTSENAGPCFGLPMRGIRLIQKNCLQRARTTETGFVGPKPSIHFNLVSRHIADYNVISNWKSVHTDQTNMCSHLASGYKNYPFKNYFTVPLLITHKNGLSYQVVLP